MNSVYLWITTSFIALNAITFDELKKNVNMAYLTNDLELLASMQEHIDMENSDYYNNTLMHYCAQHSWVGTFDFITAYLCPDLNKRNKNGYTPLMIACKHKRYEVSRRLINKKCDVTLQDNSGNTALHYCLEEWPHFNPSDNELTHLLLDAGADGTVQNNKNLCPLDRINEAFERAEGSTRSLLSIVQKKMRKGG